MTQQTLTINPERTAVLIMDFQQRIIANVASEPAAVVDNAAQALAGARLAGIPVIYVVHRGRSLRRLRSRRRASRMAWPPLRANS